MSGLGLSNALDSYQSGIAWKQQQDEIARVQRQRAQIDEANKAATDAVGASQAEWAATGAQGQYKPNGATMMNAAEARGRVLAKHGLWDQFLQNEAAVAPIKMKIRSDAMQQYQMDGDPIALARSVYPTIFDGKNITGIEKVEGADGSERLGLKPIAAKLKMKFSDGSESSIDPTHLVGLVKQSLIDPMVTAKNEALISLEDAKARIAARKEIEVGAAKGEQDRKTEDVKANHQLGLAGVRFGYDKQLHEIDSASRERVGAGNNAATVKAAQIGADSREAVADTRAAAGGPGGLKVRSSYVTANGDRIQQLSDGSTVNLGKDKTYQSMVQREVATLKKTIDAIGKSDQELEELATNRIAARARGGKPAGLGDGEAPGAPAAAASRPPLSAFNR